MPIVEQDIRRIAGRLVSYQDAVVFSTVASTATGASFQTLKSVSVPARTLETVNGLRITAAVRRTTGAGNGTFRLTYGGSAVATLTATGTSPLLLHGLLGAVAATNAQRGYLETREEVVTGTAAVDSTTGQTLALQVDLATDTDVFTCDWWHVAILRA